MLGIVELLFALLLYIDAAYSAAVGEDAWIFVAPAAVLLPLGLFQTIFFSNNGALTPSLGILLISEVWGLGFLALSVPFMMYGMSPIDSLFETISGYTTTGASVVADVEALPSGLVLWRALIQWAGGVTIVLIFTFLLPMLGVGSSGLASNEFEGAGSGGYAMKVTAAAFNFMRVYVLLTVVEVVILVILGVSPFESVCITMSDIPTGGLLPRSDSMVSYTVYVQLVTLVFMFLGASNYYLLFRLMFKKDTTLLRNREFLRMIQWFAACTLIIAGILVFSQWSDIEGHALSGITDRLYKSAYCVVSAGTGAGFAITDYSLWPNITMTMLILVAFVGGMSGSTAGGIKIYRLMILKSYIAVGLDRILHPGAVASVRINGKALDQSAVDSAMSTIMLMLLGTVAGTVAIMYFEPGIDAHTGIGLTIAAISNYGLGNGSIGPLDSLSILDERTKVVMCVLMWLGRMEMILAIIIFTRRFWSDVRISAGRSVGAIIPRRHGRKSRAAENPSEASVPECPTEKAERTAPEGSSFRRRRRVFTLCTSRGCGRPRGSRARSR